MRTKIKYTKGQKLGQCIYLYDIDNPVGRREAIFECKICGNLFLSKVSEVKCSNVKSCGCLRSKKSRERMTTHGLSYHPDYYLWKDIYRRCYNDKAGNYHKYGGRGITMCEEWLQNMQSFFNYISKLPNYGRDGYSLDRADNDGNYKPGNLRWVTRSQQGANRRMHSNNTSGFTGVISLRNKWTSNITVDKKQKWFGVHDTIKDAVDARNKYIIDNNLQQYYKIQEYADAI